MKIEPRGFESKTVETIRPIKIILSNGEEFLISESMIHTLTINKIEGKISILPRVSNEIEVE